MNKSFFILFFFVSGLICAQNITTVVYSFDDDAKATIGAPEVLTATDAVFGGSKLQLEGIVSDESVKSAKTTITNNNSTNYSFTYLRCDIKPKLGYSLEIEEIKITHRSSKAGNPDVSQTYLFRIGSTLNGVNPDVNNIHQSSENRLLPGSYTENAFTPGSDYATASGENFISVLFTARGASTSNDVFNWYIDKVEIKVSYFKLLELPSFSMLYDFAGQSRQALQEGVTQFQASAMTSKSAAEGLTTNGKYWIKLNSNTNTIAFKNFGLLFDIQPNAGYEVVMKNHEIVHAGSGVLNESCVSRMAVFSDIARDAAGI